MSWDRSLDRRESRDAALDREAEAARYMQQNTSRQPPTAPRNNSFPAVREPVTAEEAATLLRDQLVNWTQLYFRRENSKLSLESAKFEYDQSIKKQASAYPVHADKASNKYKTAKAEYDKLSAAQNSDRGAFSSTLLVLAKRLSDDNQLSRHVDDLERRFQAQQSVVREPPKTTDNKDLKDLVSRLEAMERTIKEQAGGIVAMESTIKEQAGGIVAMESTIKDQTRGIVAMESTIKEQAREIVDLKSRSMKEEAARISQRIAPAQIPPPQQPTNSNTIIDLKDIRASQALLGQRFDDLSAQIEAVKLAQTDSSNHVSTAFDALATEFDQLRHSITQSSERQLKPEDIKTDVLEEVLRRDIGTSLKAELHGVAMGIRNLDHRFNALSTEHLAKEMLRHLHEHVPGQAQIESRFKAYDQRLAEVSNLADGTNAQKMTEFKKEYQEFIGAKLGQYLASQDGIAQDLVSLKGRADALEETVHNVQIKMESTPYSTAESQNKKRLHDGSSGSASSSKRQRTSSDEGEIH